MSSFRRDICVLLLVDSCLSSIVVLYMLMTTDVVMSTDISSMAPKALGPAWAWASVRVTYSML